MRNFVNNNKFNLITSLPPDSGKICYKIKFIIIHNVSQYLIKNIICHYSMNTNS
jgi:hypothetical protein